ncbi:MAG: ComEA family DNA-binding protein [Chromatiales bacterium]|jgi:competence protein ComEA
MNYLHSLALACALFLTAPAFAEIVNVNQADAAALAQNLNGIGEAKAQKIIEYREQHGGFKSLDELANVPGIGAKTVERNRDNMSLDKGVTKVDKQG